MAEVYRNFANATTPLVTTMDMDMWILDSGLGEVQAGSILAYQQPATTTRNITSCEDAPPPSLPLDGYSLGPSVCIFVHSEHELLHMSSLAITLETAHKVESAMRVHSLSLEGRHLHKPRITSSGFKEVCHVRGQSSAEHLADRILRGTRQSAEMKRGL